MIDVLAGLAIAGCFIAAGIWYQECRYRNLGREIKVKELEKQIEELKKIAKNKASNGK